MNVLDIYFPHLIVSSVYLAILLGVLRVFSLRTVLLLSIGLFFVGACAIGSTVQMLECIVWGILAAVCCAWKTRKRSFAVASVVSSLGLHVIFLCATYTKLESRVRAREAHPYVSLADRLEYEWQRNQLQKSGPLFDQEIAEIDADRFRFTVVAMGRDEDHDFHDRSRRGWALRALHNHHLDRFVTSPGFGVRRMARASRYPERYLDLDPDEPIPQPDTCQQPAFDTITLAKGDNPNSQTEFPNSAPESNVLTELHQKGFADFVNPQGFGDAKDVQLVAGFQSHRFRKLPELPEQTRWRISRLELMSLLKFDNPRIYVSENLPRMDELRDTPTRSLNDFEFAALRQLQTDDDLVIDYQDDSILMLGSIRAFKVCLDCHQVQQGQLLGAFSYRLSRTGTAANRDSPAIKN